MNIALVHPEIQDFINASLDKDVFALSLSKNKFSEVAWHEIINQIKAKQKAKTKLPSWFSKENIVYPSPISIEQSTDEQVANFKSTLIECTSLIDLSGGFGVDSYYFSKTTAKVIHCEINAELSSLVKHNFEVLNTLNIDCYTGDGTEILKNLNQRFDTIYVDPSRRNDAKGKVFLLNDCEPNVPQNLDFYFQFSSKIFVKTSPMLDISVGISELKNVKNIYCIALNNEVKELLFEIHQNYNDTIALKAINIHKHKTAIFETIIGKTYEATYAEPEKYLYEPNAAQLKTGAFEAIGCVFQLNKLHKHTHLYTSKTLQNFDGRTFEITHVLPYHKTQATEYLKNKNLHINSRNFPLSVAELRKKWNINEGKDEYVFFTTTLNNEKKMIFCKRIANE